MDLVIDGRFYLPLLLRIGEYETGYIHQVTKNGRIEKDCAMNWKMAKGKYEGIIIKHRILCIIFL